ncbi:ion channel [Paenibacillus ferrarius]|uniref:ion channel n=1 Tax=Paenibacillus ferrarius TaxID=1469647 RepID=UPI003D299F04
MWLKLKKVFYHLIHLKGRIFFPFVIGYVLLAAAVALTLEPDTFDHSMLTSVYWVLTTLATIGFGDYAPVTESGKFFTVCLYITGIALISAFIRKIVKSIAHLEQLRVGGQLNYSGQNHIILVGWNDKAKLAIQEILTSDRSTDIVLIDKLDKLPIVDDRLFYVRGDATGEETLLQAGLPRAKGVILFADHVTQDVYAAKDPLLVDGKTLLVATAIAALEERLGVSVHITAEVMNEKHIALFKHADVDEFIPTQEMISHAAVRSIYTHGVTQMYAELMSRQCTEGMYEVPKQPAWRTYRDAFSTLLDQGATLVADRGDLHINRKLDTPVPADAQLYVICDRETLARIGGSPDESAGRVH